MASTFGLQVSVFHENRVLWVQDFETLVVNSGIKLALSSHLPFMVISVSKLGGWFKESSTYFIVDFHEIVSHILGENEEGNK